MEERTLHKHFVVAANVPAIFGSIVVQKWWKLWHNSIGRRKIFLGRSLKLQFLGNKSKNKTSSDTSQTRILVFIYQIVFRHVKDTGRTQNP